MPIHLFFRYLAATALVLGLALCFQACTAEPIPTPQPAPVTDTGADSTDYRDLIAFFDPFERVVLVLPDYLEKAIAALQMQPLEATEPWYLLPAYTMAGEPLTVETSLKLAPLEVLQTTRLAVEGRLNDLVTSDEIARETLASSTTLKGHSCQQVDIERTTRCHVTGRTSSNSFHYDRYLCVKGYGECPQWLGVIGYRYTYYNRDCSGTPNRMVLEGQTCR